MEKNIWDKGSRIKSNSKTRRTYKQIRFTSVDNDHQVREQVPYLLVYFLSNLLFRAIISRPKVRAPVILDNLLFLFRFQKEEKLKSKFPDEIT